MLLCGVRLNAILAMMPVSTVVTRHELAFLSMRDSGETAPPASNDVPVFYLHSPVIGPMFKPHFNDEN
jgi:hypothetical protein